MRGRVVKMSTEKRTTETFPESDESLVDYLLWVYSKGVSCKKKIWVGLCMGVTKMKQN
jgi:hypothetical protein